jgi:hypothetical protein
LGTGGVGRSQRDEGASGDDHFGLALFPDPSASNANCAVNDFSQCFSAPDPHCCLDKIGDELDRAVCAPGKVVVPVGANTASMILTVLNDTDPSGGTPTSERSRAS